MRTLYVTSEVYPLAKTGGLADVSAALPAGLREFGIDTRVLVPAYPEALERAPAPKETVRLGDVLGCGETRLLESKLPGSNVPIWLVDCPSLFNRTGGLYQDNDGVDWPDNDLRYAMLNYAAAAIADGAIDGWRPDLIHANDWHAGLLPLLLAGKDERPATVFTIHNLAYQGLFGTDALGRVGLAEDHLPALEFYGRISYLKAGIRGADAITTVSPTYAEEILSPEYGCGLDRLLRERAPHLTGILNGADYEVWDPRSDPHLEANFSPRALASKAVCKAALQRELGLSPDADAPLMAFMSRLVHQKMPDAVLEALPPLLESGLQFAMVAEGDLLYRAGFQELAARYPGAVAVHPGYDEAVAHRLMAGADMLAHPSRFEPCGLVPIYALRYGTIPIVRKCGGLADSVVDATVETIQKGTATGFSFDEPAAAAFAKAVAKAVSLYRQPISWRKIQANAMAQDFSWRRSAEMYATLYATLVDATIDRVARVIVPDEPCYEKLTA